VHAGAIDRNRSLALAKAVVESTTAFVLCAAI
jgi:hypothetical protein